MTSVFLVLGALTGLIIIGGIIALGYSFTLGNQGNLSMENKTKALDVFIYLGIFITLIVSVTNILQIIFTAIDRKFVDLLDTARGIDLYNDNVRFAMASLIVVFPIYLGLSWYASHDISKFLYKRDLKVRKIMIYTALFVTILTLVGTLVSLIYTFLGGELTIRFGFKALAVFVVALTVFGYYFYNLRRNYAAKNSVPLMFAVLVSIAVIISLVWSISIIGTPSEMRAKRIDSTRLSDISRIQQEIFNHFQTTDTLPQTLTELNDAFQGYAVPTDPVTKESYGYRLVQKPVVATDFSTKKKTLIKPAIFELCATFDTVRNVDSRGMTVPIGAGGTDTDKFYSAANYYYEGDQSPFWNHGIGNTCFKRVITQDMYYGR